jgi:molecular chaperone GrpE
VTPEQDTKQAQSPAVDETAGEQPVAGEQDVAAEQAGPEESRPAQDAPEESRPAQDAPEQSGPAQDAPQESGSAQDAPQERAVEPDYHDKWLRAVAELDNVRKRARRDVGAAEARGIGKLARELLPALDNFERALAAAEAQPENRDHHLTDGIRLVQSELLGALARVGIMPVSPKGERFDPHRHEAVAQQPVDGAEPGTIVEVYSAGYTYGDDVLRPAKVVVAG